MNTPTPQDGGPAFPYNQQSPNGLVASYRGMTLRDYFAAAALQGIMSYHNAERGDFHTNATMGTAAAFSYSLADAMLAARKRKDQP